MHISRAGKCVDDDDDDSALTEQRDCLRGAAPGAPPDTRSIAHGIFVTEDRGQRNWVF